MSPRLRVAAALVAGLALVPAAAGCGSSNTGGSPSSQSSQANNQQDDLFANQLVALSTQMVDITNAMRGRTGDEAREAELAQLGQTANERVALARSWQQPSSGSATSSPSSTVPGTLTEQQFDALLDSDGPQLQAAIDDAARAQRDGTIAIAQAEIADGQNPAMIEVAKQLEAQAESDYQILIKPLPVEQ